MFNVQHDPLKMAHACKLMAKMCEEYGVQDVLLEFQPPCGRAQPARWY